MLINQYQEIKQEDEGLQNQPKITKIMCVPRNWRIRSQILLVQFTFCTIIVLIIFLVFITNFVLLNNNFETNNLQISIDSMKNQLVQNSNIIEYYFLALLFDYNRNLLFHDISHLNVSISYKTSQNNEFTSSIYKTNSCLHLIDDINNNFEIQNSNRNSFFYAFQEENQNLIQQIFDYIQENESNLLVTKPCYNDSLRAFNQNNLRFISQSFSIRKDIFTDRLQNQTIITLSKRLSSNHLFGFIFEQTYLEKSFPDILGSQFVISKDGDIIFTTCNKLNYSSKNKILNIAKIDDSGFGMEDWENMKSNSRNSSCINIDYIDFNLSCYYNHLIKSDVIVSVKFLPQIDAYLLGMISYQKRIDEAESILETISSIQTVIITDLLRIFLISVIFLTILTMISIYLIFKPLDSLKDFTQQYLLTNEAKKVQKQQSNLKKIISIGTLNELIQSFLKLFANQTSMKYKKNPVCIRIEATDYPLKCDSKSMIFWKNDIVNLKDLQIILKNMCEFENLSKQSKYELLHQVDAENQFKYIMINLKRSLTKQKRVKTRDLIHELIKILLRKNNQLKF